jgi:hypothetical protein
LLVAKGNEYDGEDVGDFTERAQLVFVYKFKVDEAIKMSHVPVDQHGYVARKFLKGKIENQVLLIAAKNPDKVLSKTDIFAVVDAGIQGTTPGLITRGDKFVRASAVQIGLEIERKTGKAPELSQVLQEIKILCQARDDLSKFDVLSRLQWYLHLFRGHNEFLRAICKKARECLKDSITVEQENPKLMMEQLSHCTELWGQFWRTKGKFDNGHDQSDVPNGSGHSIPINGKRPFPQNGKPSNMASGQAKDWKGKGVEVQSTKTYSRAVGPKEPTVHSDPFRVIGKENLSATPTAICKTLWIKGWDRKKMDRLRAERCCLVCGAKGHMLKDCTEKKKLFKEEKFCFRPSM